MKMTDRTAVEGTTPTIYIGHRTYRDKRTGKVMVSKTWYAEYCRDARSSYEPLKTSSKAEAIRRAHKIVDRIETGEPRPASRRPELKEVATAYLDLQRSRGRAPKTMEKYEMLLLRRLVPWAETNGCRLASGFDEKAFWAFNGSLLKDGLTEKTRYGYLTVVKQLFKWAAGASIRLIPVNLLAGVHLEEPVPTQQPCFTPEQVGTLIGSADAHQRPIFAMMAFAGLRFGEVRDLLWTDVLLDRGRHGFLVIQRGGSAGKTKGKRVRHIPIHPRLREILDNLPRKFDRVFTALPSPKHPAGGAPVNERRLLMSLKRLCRRCKFANPKQYKLHTFRHAFASMCARNNVSYKYALEWMGHQSSEILDLYYTMFDATAEAAIRTIDYPVGGSGKKSPAA